MLRIHFGTMHAWLVGRSVIIFFFFFGESDRCDKPKHAYSGQNCEKKTQNIGIGYSAATIGIGGKKDPEIMNSQARTKYTTHTHMFVFIYQLLLSLLSTSALVAFGRTANNVNMNGKWWVTMQKWLSSTPTANIHYIFICISICCVLSSAHFLPCDIEQWAINIYLWCFFFLNMPRLSFSLLLFMSFVRVKRCAFSVATLVMHILCHTAHVSCCFFFISIFALLGWTSAFSPSTKCFFFITALRP